MNASDIVAVVRLLTAFLFARTLDAVRVDHRFVEEVLVEGRQENRHRMRRA